MAISVNVLTTSVMRQGSGEGIEAEPAFSGATKAPVGVDRRPARREPGSDEGLVCRRGLEATIGAQAQIHRFGGPVCGGELLRAVDRIRTGDGEALPRAVGPGVPSSSLAVEA